MMDNARHVPGSTTSRGTPLSQPFPAFLAFLGGFPEIRTKSVQIRPFSRYAIIYSFYINNLPL
jgi:hypothetical protein